MFEEEVSCVEETHRFSGTRVDANSLIPVNWTFTCEFIPTLAAEEGKVNKSVLTFEKVKFWIENVLCEVIVSIQDSDIGVYLAYNTDNPTILTPYATTDNHLLQLIHAKLTAIAGNELHIGLATLTNDEATTVCKYSTSINAHNLPSGDDYIEGMYHSEPWWRRPSFDFADYTANEVEGDEDLRAFLESEDPMNTFELNVMQMYNDNTDLKPDTAEIIKMPKKWKPKII